MKAIYNLTDDVHKIYKHYITTNYYLHLLQIFNQVKL